MIQEFSDGSHRGAVTVSGNHEKRVEAEDRGNRERRMTNDIRRSMRARKGNKRASKDVCSQGRGNKRTPHRFVTAAVVANFL